MTESWTEKNMFCPRCGNSHIYRFQKDNMPVADFYCPVCYSQYELKSKNGKFGVKAADGAYATMIRRITGNDNPDFLFMEYSSSNMVVDKLFMIPKFFFVPGIIEKRTPNSQDSENPGWEGCNIILKDIPPQGRIEIICKGIEVNREQIMGKLLTSQKLKTDNITARGWLMDILNCVNRTPSYEFTLAEMYGFESELSIRHKENQNIREKIRQQLQVLRDKGFISFLGSGKYRKVGLRQDEDR